LSGVAVVLAAAVLRQPMIDLAAGLPRLEGDLPPFLALPAIALVGGLTAALINNLPAAAFGSVWLVGASPAAIVAFLLGTNILNLLTPHGSLATILGRNLAAAAGAHLPASVYLRGAWRYAIAGTVAGLLPLLVWRG
jgi:arsenical pump membrane protein